MISPFVHVESSMLEDIHVSFQVVKIAWKISMKNTMLGVDSMIQRLKIYPL